MTIKRIGYSIVFVRDYLAAKDWYSKVLGLNVAFADDAGKWVTFGFPGGGAELAIHEVPLSEPVWDTRKDPIPPTQGASHVVPCLEVDDMTATVGELKARGVTFVRDIHESSLGLYLANFTDLEGNLLQLYQRKNP